MRIEVDDVTRPQVLALLEEHLRNMHEITPENQVFAFDANKLRAADVTFWTAWEEEALLGCAALKELSSTVGEVKSMRTPERLRRRGVGRALLDHVVQVARQRGYRQLFLETGSHPAFRPAQTLYRSVGFRECGPFGSYQENGFSVFMSLSLVGERDIPTNVFARVDAAQYDNARPFFHPHVYERLASLWDRKWHRTLDVACGTGQSAEALLPFAREVIAVDSSAAMLSRARLRSAIRYVRAAAERLPFVENSFDLISVGLGIHWFDQPAFLSEARRVLRAGGWLLVYDSGFPEIMRGNDAFAQWLRTYRERFPAPKRNDFRLEDGLVARRGFELIRAEPFTHARDYDFESFAALVATQSRIVRALNGGHDTNETIRGWFEETLRPHFKSPRETLQCEGWLAAYRTSAG